MPPPRTARAASYDSSTLFFSFFVFFLLFVRLLLAHVGVQLQPLMGEGVHSGEELCGRLPEPRERRREGARCFFWRRECRGGQIPPRPRLLAVPPHGQGLLRSLQLQSLHLLFLFLSDGSGTQCNLLLDIAHLAAPSLQPIGPADVLPGELYHAPRAPLRGAGPPHPKGVPAVPTDHALPVAVGAVPPELGGRAVGAAQGAPVRRCQCA